MTFRVQAPELVDAMNRLSAALTANPGAIGQSAPQNPTLPPLSGLASFPAIANNAPATTAQPAPLSPSNATDAFGAMFGAQPQQGQQFQSQPQQQYTQQDPAQIGQQFNPAQFGQQQPQQFNPAQFGQQQPQQYQQPAPQQYQQPAPQAPAQQGPAPTSAPGYTVEQLGLAGSQLVDAGRLAEVNGLLGQFGVNALMQLPPARYGEFAMALKSMGAKF